MLRLMAAGFAILVAIAGVNLVVPPLVDAAEQVRDLSNH